MSKTLRQFVFPVFDPHRQLQTLVRIFMRKDGGALLIQPLVAVRVVEVPVGGSGV